MLRLSVLIIFTCLLFSNNAFANNKRAVYHSPKTVTGAGWKTNPSSFSKRKILTGKQGFLFAPRGAQSLRTEFDFRQTAHTAILWVKSFSKARLHLFAQGSHYSRYLTRPTWYRLIFPLSQTRPFKKLNLFKHGQALLIKRLLIVSPARPGDDVKNPTDGKPDLRVKRDERQPLPDDTLFADDFERGTWHEDWYVQSLAERLNITTPGADGSDYGVRFEVRDNDREPDTGSERSELSGPTFHEGQDIIISSSIKIPPGNTYDVPWQLIQQLHEHDWLKSPGLALFLDNDRELYLAPGDGQYVYWQGPSLSSNRWYDISYRVKLSQNDENGFVEVWFEEEKQKLINGHYRQYGQTLQKPSTYFKLGAYRSSASTGTTIIEMDNIQIELAK